MHSLSDKKHTSKHDLFSSQGNHPGNAAMDEGAFHDLDQLQQLLPPEDSERFMLEEMNLVLEAHTLAKKFYTLARLHREKTDPRPVSNSSPRQDPSRLTSSIDLDDLKQQLFQKIEDEQLYLYEDLSLATLAYALEIEPYQLTRFLNHHLHTSFSDLINTYRIKAAKERLLHDPSETVLDIAFAVGFNSKASFNRVFKKTTGTTPTQYRESKSSTSPTTP